MKNEKAEEKHNIICNVDFLYQVIFPNNCMKYTYDIKVSVKSKPVIRKGITGALNCSKC